MDYPKAEELREQAARIEASAQSVSDSSEYPRVALMACRSQTEALREFAETIEQVGEITPKRPGMTGEERRERRVSILRLRAARLKVKASEHHRASHDIGSRIPFGQPILVGHHSERGHRRAIERMHNNDSKAYNASQYADTLESRADTVERRPTIQASDSDAVDQYREKLERLTRERDNMKAVNAAWRKFQRTKNPDELHALGFGEADIQTLEAKIATAYSWERQPYAGWQITNIGARIRDIQKKLEHLERAKSTPDQQIETSNRIRLEDSPSDNRVRLFFPGKPEQSVRTALKRNGFRWSPSIGCWQAYRNWHSMEHAKTYIAETQEPKNQ